MKPINKFDSNLEYLKLWKGLFYCFWMSDKPLVQQDLASQLSSLLLTLPQKSCIAYLSAFWKIIGKEWYGIDRLRLDKYYMLLRQFHKHTFLWLESINWAEDALSSVMEILKEGPLR